MPPPRTIDTAITIATATIIGPFKPPTGLVDALFILACTLPVTGPGLPGR